jgi:hypothetical protein
LAAVISVLYSMQSVALETSFSMGLRAEHTDNSLKSEANQQSDFEQSIDASLGATHRGKSIEADVDYQIARVDYDKDTQRSSTITDGGASISYEQIEEVLIWRLANTQRSVIRDKQLADIQDNRDQRSITDAELSYSLRPSAGDSLTTTVSYADIRYDNGDQQDSDRAGLGLVWSRTLSAVDSFSVNLLYNDVGFEGLNGYEYYSSSLGYQADLSKLNYRISVGYNEQRGENDNFYGGLVDAEFNYLNGGSVWSIGLLQE